MNYLITVYGTVCQEVSFDFECEADSEEEALEKFKQEYPDEKDITEELAESCCAVTESIEIGETMINSEYYEDERGNRRWDGYHEVNLDDYW